uniref:Uncharacterized protein n=1 Tax=Knipowitschia caucasica TaxID=637954 RepID=A0AAV2IY97_KNICA
MRRNAAEVVLACDRRRGCIFSHEILSSYNEKILTEFGLETLTRAQLCLLLLQSNINLLPAICFNYNNHHGCQDSCQRLHICQKFLSHDCSCFRTHDFMSAQPLKVLQDKKIPACLFTSLKSIYANKEALRLAEQSGNSRNKGNTDKAAVIENVMEGHGRKGENTGARGARGGRGKNIKSGGMQAAGNKVDRKDNSNKTEICMYFIKGHCKHEDRCFKAHSKMPYVWEMNKDGVWSPLEENERIEQSFCEPGNIYSTTYPPVYFDTMKCGGNDVRRLSTINSVQEPNFIHTTDWLWYWEDNSGKWLQYGANTSEHQITSVTSRHLEEMYLKNGTAVIQFKAGNQSYELSFQDMIQTNIQYGTKRVVRRRPKFVSAVEARTKRKLITNPTGVPEYWDKTQVSTTEHRCIDLQPSHAEYKEIQNLFSQTMKGFDILKIERIQNQSVWEAFQLQKNHMKNKNKGQASMGQFMVKEVILLVMPSTPTATLGALMSAPCLCLEFWSESTPEVTLTTKDLPPKMEAM